MKTIQMFAKHIMAKEAGRHFLIVKNEGNKSMSNKHYEWISQKIMLSHRNQYTVHITVLFHLNKGFTPGCQ